jgi:hypothetical protein
MYGTLDKLGELPPKGEFFCKYREKWMPEIPGKRFLTKEWVGVWLDDWVD